MFALLIVLFEVFDAIFYIIKKLCLFKCIFSPFNSLSKNIVPQGVEIFKTISTSLGDHNFIEVF